MRQVTLLLLLGAALAGWFAAPGPVSDFAVSASQTLSWQGQSLAGPLPGQWPVAVGAAASILGLPFLLACVAQAARAGRRARACATLLVLVLAVWGLCRPDGGPFAVGALVTAVVVAVLPGRWERAFLAVLLGVVAGHVLHVAVDRGGTVAQAADTLAGIAGGQAPWWTAALVGLTCVMTVSIGRLLVGTPAPQ